MSYQYEVPTQFEDYNKVESVDGDGKYGDIESSITSDIIFVDTLDEYMTFTDPKVEGQTTEGLNLTLTFRAFLYDSSLVENDWPKAPQEGKLIHTYWNHNTTEDENSPFKNIVSIFQIGSENGVGTNLADTLLKYKATKDEVMETARTWTITTTDDGREQLIINFGTPGSTGLTYADIFDDATIAALQESFDAEIAYIEEILGENTKNGDEGSGNDTIAAPLTGQAMPRWQWEEFKTIFRESKEYWDKDSLEHKYVYSFDAHVVTAVKYDSDTHKYDEGAFNTEKVTNGFNVSYTKGEESISKDHSATYNNFWRNGLAANAKAGDVVIFKADAAAENGTPKPWNPSAANPNIPTIESPIQGVKFSVYTEQTGGEALSFTQGTDGRYSLSDSGTTTVLITDQAGAIVITGLDKGTPYYIEEVEAAEGYEQVEGRTPITAAANVVTPYLIENTKLPSNVTVTFDKNNTDAGSTEANPTSMTVEKGGTVDALPTPPTRPGYTFTGWNTEKDGSGSEFTAETVVNENITVYAQWEKSQYTIKYEYTGTVPEGAPEPPADKKVDFGSEQTVATAPTLDGWTFTGWTTDDANVSNGSFTMPANDVTFTGSWTQNKTYKVTYVFTGDVPEDMTAPVDGNNYEAGKTVTVLTPGSVPPGYRFEGWTLGEETYEPEDTFEMPASNVTLTGTWAKLGEVVVKPAPVTIYMGGEDGHDGVVNDAGAIQANNSLPVPGFTVEWPVENVDISELVFNAGEKSWKLESYDGVSTTIYKLVPSGTQDPIRMQFTNADNVTVTSDDFEVGANVNQTLTMQLYKDSVGQVTVKIGDDTYIVDSDYTADLTVRGTTAAPEYAGVNDDITADKPGLTAPEGTVYKINGKDVLADADTVALLFDDIIDTADENRTDMLWAEAETQDVLPELETGNRYGYEFKYLDLVDTLNGNVWVQASDTVTVYWPLPTGTDAETEFTLLHFTGLHREMASGEIADEIQDCKIENVKVENTGTHVKFTIDEAGFSPFALVWQEPSPNSDMTVTKTADKDRIEVGETVKYTITVTNTGNQRLENISVTGVFSGRGELELSGETTFSLNPGESRTLTAAYKALRADAGAILTNTVTAVCGELSVNATEKVKVERPWIPTPPPGGDDDDEPEEPDDVVPPMLNGDDHYAYIIGYEDGTVRPNGQITRAEAMTMINRVLNRDPVENDDLLPDMRVWSDNRPGAWYYFAVQEATNSHEYIRPDSHEDWTEMTPDPDWERYQ